MKRYSKLQHGKRKWALWKRYSYYLYGEPFAFNLPAESLVLGIQIEVTHG